MSTLPFRLLVDAIALLVGLGTFSVAQDAVKLEPVTPIELDAKVLAAVEKFDSTFLESLSTLAKTGKSAKALEINLGLLRPDGTRPAFGKHLLVFHQTYRRNELNRCVFIYERAFKSFPGLNPQTIVICDGDLRLLHWKEVGDGSMFRKAELKTSDDGSPCLVITRRHRHSNQVGTQSTDVARYLCSLADDKVKESAEIEWVLMDERGK